MSEERATEVLTMEAMVFELVKTAVQYHDPATFSVADLIRDFVEGVSEACNPRKEEGEPLTPAVTAQTSICNDYVICLECGEQFKQISSKHLAMHGLTPNEYKAKWGFKKGQSLSCLKTAKQRSKAAKKRGVPEGLMKSIEDKRQARAAKVETPVPAPKPKRTRTPVVEEAPVVEEKRPETRRRRRQTEEEAA